MALGISRGCSEESVLHVFDVMAHRTLPDAMDRCRFGTPEWVSGRREFDYTRIRKSSRARAWRWSCRRPTGAAEAVEQIARRRDAALTARAGAGGSFRRFPWAAVATLPLASLRDLVSRAVLA
ncbi:MAG: hypothetical protein HY020_18420 [Burkholderiales bacterium]|nr:hypothetical protein [Burkholderiales bacterium]